MAETQPSAPFNGIQLTPEQFEALLAKVGSNTGVGTLNADELAKAFAKSQRRENPEAPMVSMYNPHGELNKPRPRLRAKTLHNGVELDEDTLAWEEIVALNALPPGSFIVAKANGQKIPFTVQHVKGFDGETLERVDIHYPCKDEHRYDHRAMLDYCFDVFEAAGMAQTVTDLKSLRKELDALRKT